MLFTYYEQECIPVGCVPAARWPYYAEVCFPGGVCSGGVWSGPRGVCSGGSAPGGVWSRGCLLLGRCLPRGVWSQGGVLQGGLLLGGGIWSLGGVCSQGVSAPRGSAPGGWYPSMHWGRSPLWTESQTPVKTLPWPNFVAAGNYCNCLHFYTYFTDWAVAFIKSYRISIARHKWERNHQNCSKTKFYEGRSISFRLTQKNLQKKLETWPGIEPRSLA